MEAEKYRALCSLIALLRSAFFWLDLLHSENPSVEQLLRIIKGAMLTILCAQRKRGSWQNLGGTSLQARSQAGVNLGVITESEATPVSNRTGTQEPKNTPLATFGISGWLWLLGFF